MANLAIRFLILSTMMTSIGCSDFHKSLSRPSEHLSGLSTASSRSSQFYVQDKAFARIGESTPFVPHGVNYIRLAPIGTQPIWHSNFNPETYNRVQTIRDLEAIKNSGYNLVRVFISNIGVSGPSETLRLNPLYMENLRDFLTIAREKDLAVKLTTAWLPDSYQSKIPEYRAQSPMETSVNGPNMAVLDPAYSKAYRDLWIDILTDIQSYRDVIFSVDIWNEPYFDLSLEPFNSGIQTFVFGGKNYNLSSNSERRLLTEEATVEWANTIAQGIKNRFPDLLLTASVFTPNAVNRDGTDLLTVSSDPRHPLSLTDLNKTHLDYLDLHIYSSNTPTQDLNSASFFNVNSFTKPLLIGEIGVYRARFPQLNQAATSLIALVQQACQRQVSGFLFWTWNTSPEQPDIWDLTENGGALNGLFSPEAGPVCPHHQAARPDDSSAPQTVEVNTETTLADPPSQEEVTSDFHHIHRLHNRATDSHTTSTLQSVGGYVWDQTSFILARFSHGDFNRPMYLCRQQGNALTFNSIHSDCEGHHRVSLLGYLSSRYSENATQAISRCYKGERGHLTTHTLRECDENGFAREHVLGYAPAR